MEMNWKRKRKGTANGFVFVDLDTDNIVLTGGDRIIYSKDIRKFLFYLTSNGFVGNLFVTNDACLYALTDGLVFLYDGDELDEWRKANE